MSAFLLTLAACIAVVACLVAFFAGFVMGRHRGQMEGYRKAWGLMGGGRR